MRSRVAAQTLTRKGFSKVYNLSGGIKAWKKEVAVGAEDTGLHLFTSEESPEEAIVVGFGLEMGLRDFYLSMQSKVSLESTKVLFGKLADIEITSSTAISGTLPGDLRYSSRYDRICR